MNPNKSNPTLTIIVTMDKKNPKLEINILYQLAMQAHFAGSNISTTLHCGRSLSSALKLIQKLSALFNINIYSINSKEFSFTLDTGIFITVIITQTLGIVNTSGNIFGMYYEANNNTFNPPIH